MYSGAEDELKKFGRLKKKKRKEITPLPDSPSQPTPKPRKFRVKK